VKKVLDKRKVKKLRDSLFRELEAQGTYPLYNPHMEAGYIEIRCASSYYDGSRMYFLNPKDHELMERFAMLDHALMCPRPEGCPTCRDIVSELK